MTGETPEEKNGCDDDNVLSAVTFKIENFEGSPFSSITPQVTATPKKINGPTRAVEMGLPSTPPFRALKRPEKSLIEKGYDSDMQMGPFFEEGVEDEVFVSMNESAPEEPEALLVPANAVEDMGNFSPVTALTDADIDTLKVLGLRLELEKRGMSINGLKKVLVERLKEAV